MSTSRAEQSLLSAVGVRVEDDGLAVDLSDGRTVTVPLGWYPRLANGTPRERRNWRLIGTGEGIHWPDLDEDLSVEGILEGHPSGESQASLERWLSGRPRRANKRMQPPRASAAKPPGRRRARG